MKTLTGRSQGAQYSAILHGALLLALIFGLPSFFHHKIDEEPMAISVDILPIAPMSNVKPEQKTPEKQEKRPEEEKHTEKKATTETMQEKSKADDQAIPLPSKDVMKKEKPKPKKDTPKKKEETLDSIFKSVKETAKAEESKKPTDAKAPPSTKQATSQNYNADLPLSMSETDAIRNQFQKCWDVPAGAKDAYNLVVTLHIELSEDGTVTQVELARDQDRYSSDSFFRAAADSAIRAVHRCSPLKSLPADKYGSWRNLELGFDPKEMLY